MSLPQTQEGKIVCFLTPGEEPKAKPAPPERVDSIRSNKGKKITNKKHAEAKWPIVCVATL